MEGTLVNETTGPSGQLKALVFDVDGTLYDQGRLRRAMLLRLLSAYGAHPFRGWQTARVLRAYRQAQEHLRAGPVTGDKSEAQIALACERSQVDRDSVVDSVNRWMEQEPLAILRRYVQPGLIEFLRVCKARGLRLAALSDYPADAKLEALGLSGLFDVVLSAQAAEINVFKPDPRGLLVTLERLSSTAAESMYIGDRVDVDAATAEAAGVRCTILTGRRTPKIPNARLVTSYAELQDLL
jgi:FMN phosphatase YigB (HAD superfamily)